MSNILDFDGVNDDNQVHLEELLFSVKEINKKKIDYWNGYRQETNIQIGEDIIHIGNSQQSCRINEKVSGKNSKRKLAVQIIEKGITEEVIMHLEEELLKGL